MYYPPIIDLHTHSVCSDGTLSPTELILLAKKKGLAAIALTDHDCVDGLAEFIEAGRENGIEPICGIEFGTPWEHHHRPEVHIVGLGFDPANAALRERAALLRDSRDIRNAEMCEKLTAIGLAVTIEELWENAGGDVLTRAHFANVLMNKGYVENRAEAFEKYISPGLPGYVERKMVTPEECIRTIKEAGGVAVLAHPTLYSLNMEQLEELCEELIGYGLDGIECYYSTYTSEQRRAMERLAEKMHLLPSGGSDFHGSNKPHIGLGRGKGNLEIPYSIWEALKERTRS